MVIGGGIAGDSSKLMSRFCVIVTRAEAAAAAKDSSGGGRGTGFGDYICWKRLLLKMDTFAVVGETKNVKH